MSLRFTECLRSYGRSVDWTLSGCFCTKACQSGTFSLQAYWNHEPAASAISSQRMHCVKPGDAQLATCQANTVITLDAVSSCAETVSPCLFSTRP